MPIGLNVNNPQEENPTLVSAPTTGAITFGGNVIGSGSTSSSGGDDLSTILVYGALALAGIWILKQLD